MYVVQNAGYLIIKKELYFTRIITHSLIPSALPPVIIRQSRNRERERKGEAMRILPKKETVMMVYPLILGQYIISVGQANALYFAADPNSQCHCVSDPRYSLSGSSV